MDLQRDRAWFQTSRSGYRRVLDVRCCTAADRGGGVARGRWRSARVLFKLLKTELSPIEDRGVIFGFVSAPEGSTAAVHRQNLSRSRRSTDAAREAATSTQWRASRRSPTASPSCASSPGRSARVSSRKSRVSYMPKFAADPRRTRIPDQPAVAGAVAARDADRVRDHVAGALGAAALVDHIIAEAEEPGPAERRSDLRLDKPELRVR